MSEQPTDKPKEQQDILKIIEPLNKNFSGLLSDYSEEISLLQTTAFSKVDADDEISKGQFQQIRNKLIFHTGNAIFSLITMPNGDAHFDIRSIDEMTVIQEIKPLNTTGIAFQFIRNQLSIMQSKQIDLSDDLSGIELVSLSPKKQNPNSRVAFIQPPDMSRQNKNFVLCGNEGIAMTTEQILKNQTKEGDTITTIRRERTIAINPTGLDTLEDAVKVLEERGTLHISETVINGDNPESLPSILKFKNPDIDLAIKLVYIEVNPFLPPQPQFAFLTYTDQVGIEYNLSTEEFRISYNESIIDDGPDVADEPENIFVEITILKTNKKIYLEVELPLMINNASLIPFNPEI